MYWRSPYLIFVVALTALATIGAATSDNGSDTFLPYISSSNVAVPSSTPTSTTVPTVTETVQPTPTATATKAPQGVQVIGNDTSYRDSIDALHIVGEVLNGNQSNVEFVRITANLFDSDGQIVDTDFTYSALDVLAPGEKTCFHLLFYPGPSDWASYQFEVNSDTGGDVSTGYVVTQHTGSYNVLDWYEIVGMIRNDNNETAEFVKSIATVYDQSGHVIGCDTTYVTADTLSPGESSAFKHLLTGIEKGSVDTYRLQTEGSLR